MNRALKGTYIDLVRDGVPDHELKASGDRAVFNALVRVAASAQQRGWTRPEWEIEIVSNPASRLGDQVKTTYDKKDNKRRRRTNREVLRLLTDAWKAAEKWVSKQPPPLDQETGRARARAVRDWIADADVQMPDAERKILAHAGQVAIDRGTDRPTLPRDKMLKATGLGLSALRLSLARLESARLLVLEVRGSRRGPNAHTSTPARANAYRLADEPAMSTYQYPKNGSVVPPDLFCSAPGDNAPGAPGLLCSAPPPLDSKETNVETLTISGTPEGIAAFIRLANTIPAVQVEQKPAKILPLRSVPTERKSAS